MYGRDVHAMQRECPRCADNTRQERALMVEGNSAEKTRSLVAVLREENVDIYT